MSESLWAFSLRVYAAPGIAPACLRCQDEAGADVNIVLFLVWQAAAGRRLTDDEIAAIDERMSEWRVNVVQPLRMARRSLKHADLDRAGTLRERVKAVELEAERLEQEELTRAAAALPCRPPVARADAGLANLRQYERRLVQPLPEPAVATFVELLR